MTQTTDDIREESASSTAFSEDLFLGGRVRIRQVVDGHKAGLDAVMLAAGVNAQAGDVVLELGLGSGVVSLCLMARVTGLKASGLECVRHMAALAEANAKNNGAHIDVHVADILSPPRELLGAHFDHVFANPPFMDAHKGTLPKRALRTRAQVAKAPLSAWFDLAQHVLRAAGTFTLIHRADALPDLLALFQAPDWGSVEVLPLWPRQGVPAKRLLVRARKAKFAPLVILPGLILHDAGGRYTEAADAILRDGMGLNWR